MNNTTYTVYWMFDSIRPNAVQMTNLTEALQFVETLRKESVNRKASAITMCSENTNQVGKMGASGVVDGKLPNGEVYTYTKRDALSQRSKIDAPVGTDFVEVQLDDE